MAHRRPVTRSLLGSALLAMLLVAACQAPGTPTAKPSPGSIETPTLRAEHIRPPAVAGTFYPAEPAQLEAAVEGLLRQGSQVPQEPIALIVPHAGYVYSGGVAAMAFTQLQGRQYEAVVLIGTNHRVASFRKISVWPTGAYSTPLGLMPVDSELAQSLLDAAPEHIVADTQVQLNEHSIEVELPFLQQVLGSSAFVPILIGEPSWENCQALSDALARVLRGKKALIVASTDMSHYPSYDVALQVDLSTLQAISSLAPQAVVNNTRTWMAAGVPNLSCTLCGEGPALTAMMTALELGANRVTLLQYANSGDVSFGDKSQVVGYGAVMFWKGETAVLNAEEQAMLLRITRETLEQVLTGGTTPQYTVDQPALLQPNGAFVTLKKAGQLRGCIGRMSSNQQLYATVQDVAIAAATEDARFPPVAKEELAEVDIEISVLSPMQYVDKLEAIQVGRDGLYISMGPFSGVLLPQVAIEQGWDREEFLRQLCVKAGLPEDAWQKGAILYRFGAQVFGEPSG
ncbi:MAG: AmmeMemoRadiSam system protein B [Anaerolineales bacterium]|nr:MAG: AmmeMemoRadiSam system protein B [Anaerolineales bacterium]